MNILEFENYQEKVDHWQVDFPYNTYICSIPLDFSEVPIHWHLELEIIYIKKGNGLVNIDFETMDATAGDIFFIPSGTLHGISQYSSDSMEYENIIFSGDLLLSRGNDSSGAAYLEPLFRGEKALPARFRGDANLQSVLDAIDDICDKRPHGYELFVKGKLLEFFFLLDQLPEFDNGSAKPRKKTARSDKIKAVLKYVELHYSEAISIADIASFCGFSESHFMRYFKETMGTSFIAYIDDYRLTMAARLLLASDESVLSISQEAGFGNLSYFNRVFKRKYCCTPREYRKLRV